MTTDQIRKNFLDFFASKGHRVVPSDSVVPKNDPTVLFTTAGMQQFKEQFLGHGIEYKRAATSQKCLRTDDLDKVGKTAVHHSFFEMLGNFSFGDYFKNEAIAWAWEYLTQILKIPADKLWVSVYKEDQEAKDIWLNVIKLPANRVVELGDKSNFWPSDARQNGPNGPCGPCSEIFFDYGFNPTCTSTICDPDCSCGRFAEVWNLVFTQFNRRDGGVLEPLPSKNIDTGMGLERLVCVLQEKKTNFEIDIFEPVLAEIKKHINPQGTLLRTQQEYLIADHIRSITIALADGVTPSNEGRGYVVKKLIIDITDIVLQTGKNEPAIYKLAASVAFVFKNPYPELTEKLDHIQDVIRKVEESYIRVRKERMPELKEEITKVKMSSGDQGEHLGKILFTFRDTYGLTLPTILGVVESSGVEMSVQEKAKEVYAKLMGNQQNQSRQASKMTGDVFAAGHLNLNLPKTVFWGYKQTQNAGNVLKIFVNDHEKDEALKGDEVKIILDETPFYAESGGQVGDTGTLTGKSSKIRITDTQKTTDIYLHIGVVEEGVLKKGEHVEAKIDAERRLAIKCNHTATHLLQSALREVLGSHVQQQGSLVDENRLRFDFTHPKGISEEEFTNIENAINAEIRSCIELKKDLMSLDEAKKSGALAFFAEKYGDRVRVVTIGKVSKEFCGGTHLDNTGQIGLFKIVSENAIAQGIRRIEAKTAGGAMEHIHKEKLLLDDAARALKVPTPELSLRIQAQMKRMKELEAELEQARFDRIKDQLDSIIHQAEFINGSKLISNTFINVDMNLLRRLGETAKQKSPSSVIVLGSRTVDTASLVIAVSDDLVVKNIKANELIEQIAPFMGGSGGGKPQLAQAGSKETGKIEQTVKEARNLIKQKLQS